MSHIFKKLIAFSLLISSATAFGVNFSEEALLSRQIDFEKLSKDDLKSALDSIVKTTANIYEETNKKVFAINELKAQLKKEQTSFESLSEKRARLDGVKFRVESLLENIKEQEASK